MNKDRTRSDSDTYLTQAGSLAVLRRDLARRRPHMPVDARPHASNLIEQIDNIKTPEDAVRLRPFMARSMELMAAALIS